MDRRGAERLSAVCPAIDLTAAAKCPALLKGRNAAAARRRLSAALPVLVAELGGRGTGHGKRANR